MNALIVRKGLILTRDKVIPVNQIDTTTKDEVRLKRGAGDPDLFPDFEETHYLPLDQIGPSKVAEKGGQRPSALYYPPAGVGWWAGYPWYGRSPYIIKTERNIPEGTVPMEEGARVISSGGDNVGTIEKIYTEPDEHRVTHLLISKGLLTKERKLIPTMWVDRVSEDEVHLSVDTELVESLPPYLSSDR